MSKQGSSPTAEKIEQIFLKCSTKIHLLANNEMEKHLHLKIQLVMEKANQVKREG